MATPYTGAFTRTLEDCIQFTAVDQSCMSSIPR